MAGLIKDYQARVAAGELRHDPLQEDAARHLQSLAQALKRYRPGRRGIFRKPRPPRGLYIWGDVGRGKSMLMDLFFDRAPVEKKRRIHFNAFMTDAHARIHAARQQANVKDPIPPVARDLANEATLLCFDEFQVTDVADAMILGRLFEQLFAAGVVVVATSNTPPVQLYQDGLNRPLFQPFLAMIQNTLQIFELDGASDYRMQTMSELDLYITPPGREADAKMDAAWARLTQGAKGTATSLHVLGRAVPVPRAAAGVARFDFTDLCAQPLAAADFLALAREFSTVMLDRIPVMEPAKRNEARRFVLLIDTLYDEGVNFICSAAAAADRLYPAGDGAEAFRRTVSRLTEMQSREYLERNL